MFVEYFKDNQYLDAIFNPQEREIFVESYYKLQSAIEVLNTVQLINSETYDLLISYLETLGTGLSMFEQMCLERQAAYETEIPEDEK